MPFKYQTGDCGIGIQNPRPGRPVVFTHRGCRTQASIRGGIETSEKLGVLTVHKALASTENMPSQE